MVTFGPHPDAPVILAIIIICFISSIMIMATYHGDISPCNYTLNNITGCMDY